MSTEPEAQNKWSLIVDVDSCTNCNVCVLACKDEHVGNSFPGYAEEMPKHGHDWIRIETKERGSGSMIDVGYLPVMCQHCDDAPCISAAENNAVTKRPDGIVIIDPVKSQGQKQIVEACPYHAITWNEGKKLPQHWIFDAHLLDAGWKEPRAAQVCATSAIRAVKTTDEELAALIEAENLEQLHPEYGTKPRVWYKNLYRFNNCFIGGSIETKVEGITDCFSDAIVTLTKEGTLIAECRSDTYGDFKLDGLNENSGNYQLKINAPGYTDKIIEVELGESQYLGEICLSE